MRSNEGSEVGTPTGESPDKRMLYARTRSEGSMRGSGRVSPQGSPTSPRAAQLQPSAGTSKAAKARAAALENAEIKRIVEVVGQSCMDKHKSLHKAFRDVRTDRDGNLMRGDMRRFFESHRVATRMADRFWDHITGDNKKKEPWDESMGPDTQSVVSMNTLKTVFDAVVGDHLGKGEQLHGGGDNKPHHHHHNVHGLLRPQHSEGSIISLANADTHHGVMTAEKLKKVVKQMTGKSQRRYIDKYGNIDRNDLQHMFEGYGLTPEQSNEVFEGIDKNRQGEIQFKDLKDQLGKLLGVEGDIQKKAKNGVAREPALDDITMTRVCDHIGGKAGQKYKTMQGAFRSVDRDMDDMVDRFEVRSFFRGYGSKTALADKFFDTLDNKREGKIPFSAFKDKFAPFIQPGYHPPIEGVCQKTLYKDDKWGVSDYVVQDASTKMGAQMDNFQKGSPDKNGKRRSQSERPRSNRSRSSNASSSVVQDELHQNRFGRFEGVSTYQASFCADVYAQVR